MSTLFLFKVNNSSPFHTLPFCGKKDKIGMKLLRGKVRLTPKKQIIYPEAKACQAFSVDLCSSIPMNLPHGYNVKSFCPEAKGVLID
jgi:hypothetical protein